MVRLGLAGIVLLTVGCGESASRTSPRDADGFGVHRRAVFKLSTPDERYVPAFAAQRPGLERMRLRAGERTGFVQPDLDLVRSFAVPPNWSDADARTWASELDAEWVVLRLAPVASPEDLDPPTPSYVDAQGYRGSESGIGVVDAFQGAGVAIHEVEYGWRSSHEDLVDVDLHLEPGQTVAADALEMGLAPEHGTATAGMLVAPHNGYGIDGLVPAASFHTYPEWSEEEGLRRANAVASAVSNAEPGDIVMLQMQAQDPGSGQLGPAEIEQDVWMLTRMATDAGVLVVSAGGNGAFDLDGPEAASYRAMGDSGAILVGAGSPGDRAPLPFSSFGSRVDLQGWGASVFTAGYGDFERLGDDDNQAYTDTFEGTSAALPMVVAASAAVIEAHVSERGMPPVPGDIRRLLAGTGRPQADGVHVGPLPDVGEAVAWVGARELAAPAVEISMPASDEEFFVDLGEALEISVDVAVDDESPLYRVEIEVDASLSPAFDEAPPYTFDLSLDEGEHVVRARATDVWGNAAWSQPRMIVAAVEDKPVGTSSGGHSGTSGGSGDSTGAIAAGGDGGGGCTAVPCTSEQSRFLCVLLLPFLRRARRKRTAKTST